MQQLSNNLPSQSFTNPLGYPGQSLQSSASSSPQRPQSSIDSPPQQGLYPLPQHMTPGKYPPLQAGKYGLLQLPQKRIYSSSAPGKYGLLQLPQKRIYSSPAPGKYGLLQLPQKRIYSSPVQPLYEQPAHQSLTLETTYYPHLPMTQPGMYLPVHVPQKKRSRRRWLIVGIVLLVVLAACGGTTALVFNALKNTNTVNTSLEYSHPSSFTLTRSFLPAQSGPTWPGKCGQRASCHQHDHPLFHSRVPRHSKSGRQ
jgi:hypothetical protein